MGTPEATGPPPSGSKKRAYEALERRFGSIPQANAPQESKANKSKALESRPRKRNVARGAGQGGGTRDQPGADRSPANEKIPTNAPFWKNTIQGVSGISDDNPGKLKHPAYFGLSMTLDENLIKIGEKNDGNGVGYANKFMHDLLLNGDCSQKYMKGTQNMKFDDWFLLDNLAPKVSSTNERAKSLQSHSRRSKKHMSLKQHRKCGSLNLPQEFHSFNLFKPMHEMWKDYIVKLLKDTGRNQMSPRLLTADLHGAMLLVVECKTTAFTGIKGIMVRETKETFGIVTEKDKFRVVPKIGSVFTFQAGSWKITLIGDELSSRIIGK